MKPNATTTLVALVCSALLTGSALAQSSSPSTASNKSKPMSAKGESSVHAEMMKGMQSMRGMHSSGNADHDFAQMMRMHHEGGIRMAEAELATGKDPKMKEMAQRIIDSQKKEIAEFDAWLKDHKSK